MTTRPIILLVEDNPADEMLACRTIKKAEIDCDVQVARDGFEACQILFESGLQPPTLVLLDLRMPKMNGFEVLTRIRASENMKHVPVIVFSSSAEPQDVDKSFDLHANSYVQKDIDPECYESRLKLLLYYWTAVNERAGYRHLAMI